MSREPYELQIKFADFKADIKSIKDQMKQLQVIFKEK